MPDPLFASALLGAAVGAGGAWLVVCAVLPRTIRLGDAFGVLAEPRPGTSLDSGPALVADATSRLELSGAWLYQHARLPLPAGTARTLVLTGRTVGDYFCNKLVLAGHRDALPATADQCGFRGCAQHLIRSRRAREAGEFVGDAVAGGRLKNLRCPRIHSSSRCTR